MLKLKKKWPEICWPHFQMHFCHRKGLYLTCILLKFVPGFLWSISQHCVAQVTAWCRTFPGPMMMKILTSICWKMLTKCSKWISWYFYAKPDEIHICWHWFCWGFFLSPRLLKPSWYKDAVISVQGLLKIKWCQDRVIFTSGSSHHKWIFMSKQNNGPWLKIFLSQ